MAGASTAVPAVVVRRSLAGQGADWRGLIFQGLLLLSVVITLLFLFILLADVFSRALPVFTERGGSFLSSSLSSSAARSGVIQGLFGSFVIAIIVVIVAFPIGIMTAIYLEEYAPDTRLTQLISINIRNLAGVPSVVYGLLGLAVFVQLLGPLTGGRSVIAGGLTLAVLVLPIVIITSAESLRAVPQALREAGYGIGASRWQVTRSLVLPSAAPGILTGTVLSLSRALGETAPLIVVGAVSGYFSTGNASTVDQLFGRFTALPMIVFNWAREPQQSAFGPLTAAAIVVLLLVTLSINAFAILLRNRFEKNW
ncbi:MAG: phosphate ABC transporter permease PstA [Chloroflexi bacterium]|nr:phosphate ABC transporter permease PstA [Chloroflexota bacterium]